jgi:integral membrane protein
LHFTQTYDNMKQYFSTTTGRLRLYAFLEGISLLVLVFLAVPMKYIMDDPGYVKVLGPVHGALFMLFIINALRTGIEQSWKAGVITKVILACFVPFGTFYIDLHILRKMATVDAVEK